MSDQKRCCGACKFWTPTLVYALACSPHRRDQEEAQRRADESGLCVSFSKQQADAHDWIRSSKGPFWGKTPSLEWLTHADDGTDCGAFEQIDSRTRHGGRARR